MSKHSATKDIISRIHDLAWNGKHVQAITLATQELEKDNLTPSLRMDLLDMRSESYIATGELNFALQDASAMMKLAKKQKNKNENHKLMAQALNRLALVKMRMGELKAAIRFATQALKAGQQSKHKPFIALSFFRLSEAQMRKSMGKAAIETAKKAISIYQQLGDDSGAGRAYWSLANAYINLYRAEELKTAGETALMLCQRAGDKYGVGNAFNLLALTDTDLAERIQHIQQALQAFEAAGYKDRQAVVLNNLALIYTELGLYHHGVRLFLEVIKMTRAMGARVAMAYAIGNIPISEIILGDLVSARLHLQELATLVPELDDPNMDAQLADNQAELALAEGDFKSALHHGKAALKIGENAETGEEHIHLIEMARVLLAMGNPVATLKATTKATAMHRAQNFANPEGFPPQIIWWWHTQALNANQKTKEAREALDLAYNFLLEGITSIRDVGLRRNYLNKVKDNRQLLQFWLADGKKRNLPQERLLAYLHIESNTREPFTRLTNTSQRLNLLKEISEIQTFLVEEATELSGAERVMLILEVGKKLAVAESILPVGEEADKVLVGVKKHLTSARLSQTVQLILPKKQGHSRIIAPLIAQNQIIGYLYADMDSIYGSFDETDRDMLGMLANQAAVALDNAGLVTGLEHKVNERTAQLQLSVNETQRLLKESQTLSNVGLDISSSLDFKIVFSNIVNYAKDLLDGELSALFLPDATGAFRAIAVAGQYAKSLQNELIYPGEGILGSIVLNRTAEIVNESDFDPRAVIIAGTEVSTHEHILVVPLLRGNEVEGIMSVWRVGLGKEFSESEKIFLENLSRQAVIALKNAQLFSDAEAARKLAEKANRTKSAFLANMSHELRTPLNAIINFTELVTMEMMGPVTDEQNEALGYSLSSSQHLLQLINDVLDISKIQAGKLSLFMEEKIDLQSVIDETLTIIEPSVKKQADLYGYKIKLIRDVDKDLPLVTCDQRRIKQVLLNLLSNAVKFTEKGSVTLSAKRKDGHILFSVMDTGKGIAPELQAQIFEPFVQTLDGIKHAEGTGLGLPITKSLVEAHGGTIWLESEVGEGSSLFFTLPAY